MLAVNETNMNQVVYDRWGEAKTVCPQQAAYLSRWVPGFRDLGCVSELVGDGQLTLRRSGGLGDLLYLSPSLMALARPVKLIVAPWFHGLFDQVPGIETVTDGREHLNLDWSVEPAEKDGWSEVLRSESFARILGVTLKSTRPVCGTDRAGEACKAIESVKRPLVIFHPRAAGWNRVLSPVRARAVGAALKAATDGTIMVVHDQRIEEFDGGPWINATGNFKPMRSLIGLVHEADLVVGVESGICILAESLNRPCVMMIWASPVSSRIGPDWKTKPVCFEDESCVDADAVVEATRGLC
jgi:ADP-heptose:LPS heptosyltransferase